MCQVKCPVGINTGELIKSIRERELKTASTATNSGADALARNFSTFAGVVPGFLNFVSMAHGLLGGGVLRTVSKALNSASGNLVPVWNEHMPTGAPALPPRARPRVATRGDARLASQGCVPSLLRHAHDGSGEG